MAKRRERKSRKRLKLSRSKKRVKKRGTGPARAKRVTRRRDEPSVLDALRAEDERFGCHLYDDDPFCND